jgi:DNA-binding beta-propeller fold protein YncE
LSGGVVSTIAGTGVKGCKDGPADEAQLSEPSGIALDPRNGDVYFSDWGSHRLRVVSGGVVSTVAGTGEKGFEDGPADRAMFNGATGITLDPESATLYVCDFYNKRLRSVALSGPLNLSVPSCASLLSASPRSLLCRNSRGLTPVEMARLCGEGEDVVKFLEARTRVAMVTNEVHPGASEETFAFWYHFWDEL